MDPICVLTKHINILADFDGDKHLSPNFFNCWDVLLSLFTTVVLETALLKRLRFDKNRIGIISSEAPTDYREVG